MNKLLTCSMVTALMVTGGALAQAQETQPPAPTSREGKASERMVPGKSPTQEATVPGQTPNSAPSTSPAEGTAADSTPPGKTPTMTDRAAQSDKSDTSKIVGREVVSATNAPLGKVTEVIFDAQGQPDFVVIASEGKSAAVPYATANSMARGNKIVMDQSRLSQAPKVKQGEWRSSSGSWKTDSQRYWNKG